MNKSLTGFVSLLVLFLMAASVAGSQSFGPVSVPRESPFDPAVRMILGPVRETARYDYVMTGRVRLLLLWVGADDVGGGYIRRGVSPASPDARFIEVLFGSDPSKAPRRINKWGAATEIAGARASAFMGFMTSAKSVSASEAEAEIRRQKERGQYAFEAIVSLVNEDRAMSRALPLFSDVDFNFREFDRARQMVSRRLTEPTTTRQLSGKDRQCGDTRGFLQAVDELVTYALDETFSPRSLCYVYNARNYTATIEKRTRIDTKHVQVQRKDGMEIDRTYRDVISAHFSVLNHKSRERTEFDLLLGTKATLRGVPLQIVYQPSFWFQAVLNLDTIR